MIWDLKIKNLLVPRNSDGGGKLKICHKSGFTLAETVVYIAVFVVFSALIIDFSLSLLNSWGHGKSTRAVARNGTIIANRIAQEIRLSSSVSTTTSTFDSSNGRLEMQSFLTATSTTPEEVAIYLSGTELFIQKGVNPAVSLSGEAKVTSLVFNYFSSSTTEATRVALTVETGAGKYTKSRNFQTFAVLRGQ